MDVAVTCGPIAPPVCCSHLSSSHTGADGWCRARLKGFSVFPAAALKSVWVGDEGFSRLSECWSRDCVSVCYVAQLGWFQCLGAVTQWWGLIPTTEQICSFTAVLGLLERKITPFSREVVLVGWKSVKENCHINWWSWSGRVEGAGEKFELELQEAHAVTLACSQGQVKQKFISIQQVPECPWAQVVPGQERLQSGAGRSTENGASPKGAPVLFILHVPSLSRIPEGRTQCKLKTEVVIAEKKKPKKPGDGLRSCCRRGRS